MKVQIFALMFFMPLAVFANSETHLKPCPSGKEFVTTVQYLRTNSVLAVAGDDLIQVASRVSAGCEGSAKRFISTIQSLQKTEVTNAEKLQLAVELANREQDSVETFNHVFRWAYARDGFDLEMASALKLAREVAILFPGDQKRALEAFKETTDFCSKSDKISIPRPACAELSKEVALTTKQKMPSSAKTFIESYNYLREKVKLPQNEAIELAKTLLQKGHSAFENFKTVYEYSLSKNGFAATQPQAIQLGKKIAEQTAKSSRKDSSLQ